VELPLPPAADLRSLIDHEVERHAGNDANPELAGAA
jgi:hypothetical protein